MLLTDSLPKGLTVDADTVLVAEQGSYDTVTGVWSVGNLDADQVVTLSISATVD